MPGRADGGKRSGLLGRERLQGLDQGDECQIASEEYGDDDCSDENERQEWRPPLLPGLVGVVPMLLVHAPSITGRAGGDKRSVGGQIVPDFSEATPVRPPE